jgi:hypothetical protein
VLGGAARRGETGPRRRRLECRRRELDGHDRAPALPWGHPDFVLAAAVRKKILTQGQAELIGRTRLEGIPLRVIAAETGTSHSALCNRRKRAEDAIAEGLLDD